MIRLADSFRREVHSGVRLQNELMTKLVLSIASNDRGICPTKKCGLTGVGRSVVGRTCWARVIGIRYKVKYSVISTSSLKFNFGRRIRTSRFNIRFRHEVTTQLSNIRLCRPVLVRLPS